MEEMVNTKFLGLQLITT